MTRSVRNRLLWRTAVTMLLLGLFLLSPLLGASAGGIDYAQPPLLTGSIHEMGSETGRVLFTFRRTAERTGAVVRVLSEYRSAAGSVAVRERVVYQDGRLVSYELEELQTGSRGRAEFRSDPQHGKEERIFFEYTRSPGAKMEKNSESQRNA